MHILFPSTPFVSWRQRRGARTRKIGVISAFMSIVMLMRLFCVAAMIALVNHILPANYIS
jgi:hypothetical protein